MRIALSAKTIRAVCLAVGTSAGLSAGLFAPPVVSAQAVAVRSSAALSADTVGIGDVFELTLSLDLPGDRIAYFPDSLEASSGIATFGPVEWSAEDRSEDGSATLRLTYSLLAVQVGIVSVPAFDIYTRPGRPEPDALVGEWEAFLTLPSVNSSATAVRVPESRLWVASVLMLDDITNGLQPRPADDVWGGDRHWPSTLLMLLFGALFVGVGATMARDWIDRSKEIRADPTPPRTSKEVALGALDELLASGLHTNGRIDDFYLRSSDIARRYIETLDDSWDAAYTSGELMEALGYRSARDRDGGLRTEMGSAETVKFGRIRPETEAAEAHWRALYEWIEESGAA